MRIAHLVHQFPKLSETFILSQINGLLALGHEAYICAQEPGDEDVQQPAIKTNDLMARTRYAANRPDSVTGQVLESLRTATVLGLRDPKLLARTMAPDASLGPKMYLHRVAWARTLAERPPPDILHCHFGTLQHAGMNLLSLCPPTTRLVVSIRGRDITTIPKQHGSEIYHGIFQAAHLFLPCCMALGRRLEELGCPPERIRVVHCGIDVGRFPFTPRAWTHGEPLRLACVGRFTEKKGFDDAIRALALLGETVPAVSLTIIGDGPLRQAYEDLAAELGVADAVTFPGPVAHDGLPSVLAPCHIFLAPSRTASDGDQEGIANTIKEAMALGIPVIATDHSGTGELVVNGETGFLVPEHEPEALAGGVRTLLERQASWATLTERAREAVVADFGEDVCNRTLVEAYEAALGLGNPRNA